MTNTERTNTLKQWTYISVIFGVLGAAVGFGINEGMKTKQDEITALDLIELKIQVKENRDDRIEDRLLLKSIEKDISYIRKTVEGAR